ncbi:MAG: carbohydrate ABC transporter permease [Anaerolineales bacterium]|jgi:N-acetylglucosamine transport system permease protein
MNRHKYRVIIPFLAPAVILYLTFVIYPYVRSMYNSFTSWKGVSANQPFVGLYNYQRMINDEFFWNALWHNVQYLLFLPAIILFLSLFLAFVISQGVKGSKFYRVVFFFPQVVLVISIAVLWSYIYHPTVGILTSIAEFLHMEPFFRLFGFDGIPVWVGDPRTVRLSIGAVVVWQSAGFYMILFLAAMEGIPNSFYEAATLDGATRWHQFWKITIPLLWDTMQTAMVYVGLLAFNMFAITQVMVVSGSSTGRPADVLATYLYEQAFLASRFGYATAIGVALFLLMLTLSALTMRVTRRESVEF